MSALLAQTHLGQRCRPALCSDRSLHPPWSCCRPRALRNGWAVLSEMDGAAGAAGLQARSLSLLPFHLASMLWGPGIHLSQRLRAPCTGVFIPALPWAVG